MNKYLSLITIIFSAYNTNAQSKKLQFEDNTPTNYMTYNNLGLLTLGEYGDNGKIGRIFLSGTRNNLTYGQGGELEFDGGYGTKANILMKYTGAGNQTWLGITSSDNNYPLRIGIGKTNPSSTLDIDGEVKASAIILGEYGDNGEIGKVFLSGTRNNLTYGQGGELEFDGGYGTKANILMKYTGAHNQTWLGVTSSDDNYPVKVGIGTNSPDSELTVKGKIHTQEVKVDLLGSVMPDFVFEETYNLRTLEETEKFIKSNKHLPGIPSATDVAENGLLLKEMNLKLLQKLEEVTLHLIEQNKKIEELQSKVEQLEIKE